MVGANEMFILCGNLNGQVGTKRPDFDVVLCLYGDSSDWCW